MAETPLSNEDLVAFYAQHPSTAEVARVLGCALVTARKRLRQAGVVLPERGKHPASGKHPAPHNHPWRNINRFTQ